MRESTFPLLLLVALTFFTALGRSAISDADEAFYAEAAREMVESGDWVTPHFNYEPRFQKPILYYWMTAGTFAVTGSGEATSRLWSALAAVGLVLIAAACGRHWYDDGVGLLGGAIVATNFGYFSIGRMALPDLPLTFFMTLAIWAAFVTMLGRERFPQRWVLLSAAAMGLAFLTKGPVGVVLPALVVVPVILFERRSLNLRPADVLLGVAIFAVIALPWYGLMWQRHGTPYLQGFFLGDNLERFATDRFNDPRPWWYYGPVLLGGLLPWAPLALLWLAPIGRFLTRRHDISTIDLRLLLWAAVPLVFYSVSVGKQPRYILPVLPPMALLLASTILAHTREWRSLDGARVRPRRPAIVMSCAGLVGAVLVIVGALVWRAQPLLVNVPDAHTHAAAIVIAVAGLVVGLVALSGAWRMTPAVIASAAAIMFPALQYGVLSTPGDDTVQQMAKLVMSNGGRAGAVGTHDVFVRNLIFYTGLKQQDLGTDADLRSMLARPDRVLVLAPAAVIAGLEKDGIPVKRLASLQYFNPASIRLGTLIWPDPTRDLSEVVLVANR